MTTYSQKARENATNSELDAKKIVTHSGLTSAQRNELIEQYTDIVLDRMDYDELRHYVMEDLHNRYSYMSSTELRDYIVDMENSGDPTYNLYDELVDNITSTDPVVYNTNMEAQ